MKKEKIILARYISDNGDIFVQLPDPFSGEAVTAPEIVPEIKCKAVFSKDPIDHLNYYDAEGNFIATAGVHVHKKHAEFTEFLYEKRVSGNNQTDTISEMLYFEDAKA